jgi:hypothetical protein
MAASNRPMDSPFPMGTTTNPTIDRWRPFNLDFAAKPFNYRPSTINIKR